MQTIEKAIETIVLGEQQPFDPSSTVLKIRLLSLNDLR
jgi:hypothetical protein